MQMTSIFVKVRANQLLLAAIRLQRLTELISYPILPFNCNWNVGTLPLLGRERSGTRLWPNQTEDFLKMS